MIGTLAVDGWAVTFGTARRGLGGAAARQAPPRYTEYNGPPINGQCTNSMLFDVALSLPLESKGLTISGNIVSATYFISDQVATKKRGVKF